MSGATVVKQADPCPKFVISRKGSAPTKRNKHFLQCETEKRPYLVVWTTTKRSAVEWDNIAFSEDMIETVRAILPEVRKIVDRYSVVKRYYFGPIFGYFKVRTENGPTAAEAIYDLMAAALHAAGGAHGR